MTLLTIRIEAGRWIVTSRGPNTAAGYAQQVVAAQIETMARQEGADQVEVRMIRLDQWAPVAIGLNQQIYLGTELQFTAAGRPSPARR